MSPVCLAYISPISPAKANSDEIARLRAANDLELAQQLKRSRRESGEHLAQLRAAGEAKLAQVRDSPQPQPEAEAEPEPSP